MTKLVPAGQPDAGVVAMAVVVVMGIVVAWSIVSNFTDPTLHASASANANQEAPPQSSTVSEHDNSGPP